MRNRAAERRTKGKSSERGRKSSLARGRELPEEQHFMTGNEKAARVAAPNCADTRKTAGQAKNENSRLLFDFKRLSQLERQARLRLELDVAVASEGRAASSGSSAHGRADGGALAAAGYCADDGAGCGSAANHLRRALAFTLGGHCRSGRAYLVGFTVNGKRIESEGETGSALEPAGGLRFLHESASAGAFGDGDFAVHFDGARDGGVKFLAGLADL